MKKVVLASSNAGKLKEMVGVLSDFGMDIHPQSEFGVDDADETGLTFIENAILKARHAALATGLPAIADDSGIEVDALKGAPGIYSARFAAMHQRTPGPENNNTLLLEKLEGIPMEKRTARFRSVIAYMRYPEDQSPIIAEGSWEGHILFELTGNKGFGYDPLFLAPETNNSAGLMDSDTKNSLSHRAKALKSLLAQIGPR